MAASVRPLAGKAVPLVAEPAAAPAEPLAAAPLPPSSNRAASKRPGPKPSLRPAAPAPPPPPDLIEPLRRRRIVRGRDPIDSRLDLHGLDQDRARVALVRFLQRAHGEGLRAVLVITGKGALGDGILRRRAPDWLEDPLIRLLIAGVSPADRRHGGAGAFYIALKRRT